MAANTGLQNLPEDYLYDKLPPGIIALDERNLLRGVIGGIQDRLEDLRAFAKKYEFFFDAAGIESHNTSVLVTFQTTYGVVITRTLEIQDDTPPTPGTVLTAWAANEMGVDTSQITSCVFGVDLLRFVDTETLQYLAATVGAVLYSTAAQSGTPAQNQQRLMDSYFPRLKIKGTVQSFDILGRLIGFEDVRMTPLWGRVSPRLPNDFGNPVNDPDFAEVPVYTPQQVIGPSYDPHVFRDGPYYSWTGTASADPLSSSFYTQSVNGFQPWVQVNIIGTVVHPDPGVVGILAGGGPHTKATVEVGQGLQFAALAEGADFNGLEVTFASWNSGTNRLVSITDRLSSIKYRTSYFDLAHTMTDQRAIQLFGTNTARPNTDLQKNPTLVSDGTAASPFRPWAGGEINSNVVLQDFVYISSGSYSTVLPRSEATIQQSQHNTDALQGAGQQALQALEEIRPATRLPRRSAVGYLDRNNVKYAPIDQFGLLYFKPPPPPTCPGWGSFAVTQQWQCVNPGFFDSPSHPTGGFFQGANFSLTDSATPLDVNNVTISTGTAAGTYFGIAGTGVMDFSFSGGAAILAADFFMVEVYQDNAILLRESILLTGSTTITHQQIPFRFNAAPPGGSRIEVRLFDEINAFNFPFISSSGTFSCM